MTATAGLTTAVHAQDVQYTLGKAAITEQAGQAKPVEGTSYLTVPVMAKNLTHSSLDLGGMSSPNFQVTNGEYTYDVDIGTLAMKKSLRAFSSPSVMAIT